MPESDARSVIWTLSLRLCSAQLLKEQVAEYTSCFALARSPCTSLTLIVMAVADGLFGQSLRVGAQGRSIPPHPTPVSCMWFLRTLRNMKKMKIIRRRKRRKRRENVPSTAPVHHRAILLTGISYRSAASIDTGTRNKCPETQAPGFGLLILCSVVDLILCHSSHISEAA